MDSIRQYSPRWCFYSIDVVEIIHGQYLKGFLLSERRKKCTIEEVFSVLGNPGVIICMYMYMYLESYTKSLVLRGCTHNLGALLRSEDCCVNTAGG